ncbi:MAG: M1 family aminopeptidase [Planctomycetota bacterium]
MQKLYRASLVVLALLLLSGPGYSADRRGPFTKPPQSVRGRDFDQKHVRLELDFNWERQEVRGRAIHTLSPYEPLGRIEFDAVDMKITKVALVDGEQETELKHESRGGKLSVTLTRELKPEESIRLAIDYLVTEPVHGAHFVLPDEQEPNQPKMVWTQGEPEYARYWFPCLDHPSDRLTSEIVATVPNTFFVLSNGVLKEEKDNGNGTRTWHWVQEQSHVTYLMSVVAGEFEAYEQEWEGTPIVSYVPKGRLADAARSFEKTPAMTAFFSEKFGYRYPWPKYTQICVDEYMWGGMEHTSSTTLNVNTLHDERAHLDTSSDGLVAHELVHQWFGDLVTCKDWGELWLNESFATYFTNVWAEHDLGPEEAAWKRHEEAESYFKEDKDRYRRPIVSYRYDTPNRMFDRHSYPKGGRVLHMLRFVLGDEPFWKSICHYTKKHEFGTVETAQFRIAIEEATGQGLNWFFDQWLHHGGHPEYDVRYTWDEAEKSVALVVKQVQAVDEVTPLFRMPIEIELVASGETAIRRITVAKAEETFHFTLDERPSRVSFDPNDWVLKKLMSEKSKEEWLDQLAHDEHMICRFRAADALGEFTKDGDALAALAEAAKNDAFWAVRKEAVASLAKFSGDPVRSALLEAAKSDPKSFVRREALKALGKFSHDETRQTLREVIQNDQSYEAVAEALRALVKVDRDHVKPDLTAAMDRESHGHVILKAAADGLAELKDEESVPKLRAMLDAPSTPDRRAAVMSALAKLKADDPEVLEVLAGQLDDVRREVRTAACEALAAGGNPAAIPLLVARREKEGNTSMLFTIDENLEKLREQQTYLGKLRKQLDALEKENRKLEERLKKLEDAEAK